jgi:hypothetical protein
MDRYRSTAKRVVSTRIARTLNLGRDNNQLSSVVNTQWTLRSLPACHQRHTATSDTRLCRCPVTITYRSHPYDNTLQTLAVGTERLAWRMHSSRTIDCIRWRATARWRTCLCTRVQMSNRTMRCWPIAYHIHQSRWLAVMDTLLNRAWMYWYSCRGRGTAWYSKVYCHTLARQMARLRDSFRQVVAAADDGPETKV